MRFAEIAAYALATASLASAYRITGDGVRCRSGPSTSSSVKMLYAINTDVTITCQTEGTTIFGNSIWGKTSDGCYVTDYYVKTGTNQYVTEKCGGGSTPPAATPCKSLNTAGINLIKKLEGFIASPQPDPLGLPSVGYGHLCDKAKCAEVNYKFPLSKSSATKLLKDDISEFTGCLADYLNTKPKLNDNQWAALTSWAFNIGCGNAKSSSLIERLNKGENANTVAYEELPKWRLGGGKVMQGLVNRRKDELELFRTASSKAAYPKCE